MVFRAGRPAGRSGDAVRPGMTMQVGNPAPVDLLPAAMEAHRSGQVDRAALLYRLTLADQPSHAGVLHMLGLIVWRLGNLHGGIVGMGRAARLSRSIPGLATNLGNALSEASTEVRSLLGKNDRKALDWCRLALTAMPDSVEFTYLLMLALRRCGEVAAAFAVADELRARGRSDRVTHRHLQSLQREMPEIIDVGQGDVVGNSRLCDLVNTPRSETTTVLVAVEGEWHHWIWGQVAMAFRKAGARVVLMRLTTGRFRELAEAGEFFDLTIVNQAAMNHLLFDIRNAPDLDWSRHYHSFAIFQFHDICTELFTLSSVANLRRRYGFQVKYWAYCSASVAFLRKHFPDIGAFYCQPPLSRDEILVFDPDFGRGQTYFELADRHIGQVSAFLAGGSGREPAGIAEQAIYFGAYEDALTFCINPEAPRKPTDVIADGRAFRNGTTATTTRVGFVDWMIDRGRVTGASATQREMLDLGEYLWIFSRSCAFEERGRPVQLLKSHFGDRVRIFGDNWERLKVDYSPPDFAIWPFSYAGARVSLDFGSQFVDSCLYPRTLQILGFGGRLLQRRKYDSDFVYGRYADALCFDDDDDLIKRLGRIFENRETADETACWQEANRDLLRLLDPARIAGRVLSEFFNE